ncbi:autotransporter domain-containing protein [Agrobacterium tumefaciens]|uniref:autotransporter domain-containing protein n=1 Tax=Agrobacterium tumefaciens TaxID=358 RepID=UPI001E639137|nr:autotransporter domain-containing protein [Agrobacterium tumefaciens]
MIVGTSNSDQAFRWTTKTGMRTLGTLTGTDKSSAMAVSADGSIIVGVSTNAEVQRAFRWSAATGVMTAIDMPDDVTSSLANDVSLDGKVVVGEYFTSTTMHAFRWTATDGAIDIGKLPGSSEARALATNKDGTIIAGASMFTKLVTFELDDRIGVFEEFDPEITYKRKPIEPSAPLFTKEWHGFRWNAATGFLQPLEETPSGTGSLPYAVSADGSVIVGNWEAAIGQRGFRWTETTGMVSVEQWLRSNGVTVLADFTLTATGVSADGNIIVGQTKNNTPYIARIVLADTGTSGPSTTLDDVDASASGVTGNGGRQPRGIDLTNGSGTSTPTPTSSGSSASSTSSSTSSNSSTSASPSGSSSASTSPATTTSSPAPAAGASPVASAPAPSSAAPAAGASYAASAPPPASAPPAPGESHVASGPPPASAVPAAGASHAAFAPPVASTVTTGQSVLPARSGIIDLHQYASTLTARPNAGIGLAIANTVMDGAHGAPMRSLLEPGRQSFSIVSDIGDNDGRGAAGGFGIADIGYGIGLEGGATARISFGGLYHHRDIDTGGDFTEKGFYIASEISLPVAGALHATIGGYYAPGRMSIERGYLNGGAMNYSRGETDLDVWAAKLRFDWLDTFSIGEWNLTPYAGVTYAKAKMGAYSETGGAFPAHFDASGEQSTIIRAGLDGVTDLSDSIRILARAEAVYRLEKKTATTTGVIDGLMGFSFAGQDIDHFWLRGGLGAEFDVAGGTASLNLNVTSEGGDPDLWVRTGWKIAF